MKAQYFAQDEKQDKNDHSCHFSSAMEVVTRAISQKNKCKATWLERSQTISICKWHDFVYKNPKQSTKILLELKNEFSKVAVYKVNIQKSIAFLYTSNGQNDNETKKTFPFKITSKRIKYLGMTLTK